MQSTTVMQILRLKWVSICLPCAVVMNGKRKIPLGKILPPSLFPSSAEQQKVGGARSRKLTPSCTEYPRASMRKNGESNSERCQVDQGDQSAVSGGEDHQNTDIRLQVLEGAVLRPLV